MANTNAPFGFRCVGSLAGNDFRVSQRKIQSTYSTAIFRGDAVISASGYITQLAAAAGGSSGVAVGFAWLSKSLGYYTWFKYWNAASDAAADADVWVVDDPGAVFQVQAGATALTLANIGQNIDIVVGTGNTANGLSGFYLAGSPGTTTTFPFKITAIPGVLTGDVFTDSTSAYNVVEVTFNSQSFKTLGGTY